MTPVPPPDPSAPVATTVASPTAEMPPGRRKLLLFVALPLLLMAGLGVGYVGISGFKAPVTVADRGVLLTVDDVARRFHLKPAGEGTFKHVRHLSGSHRLEYKYQSPAGAQEGLIMICQVVVDGSGIAIGTYGALRVSASVGFKVAGGALRLVDQVPPFRWGDESSSSLIQSGDKVVGNAFTARKGRRVFHLLLVGVFFKSPDQLGELLSPVLARLDAYSPD
jgi:hypothetical protein